MEYVRGSVQISAKYYYGIITSFIESHTIPVLSSSLASCRSAALGDCADMVMYWPGIWTVYSVIPVQPPSVLPARRGSIPGRASTRHPDHADRNVLPLRNYGSLLGLQYEGALSHHPVHLRPARLPSCCYPFDIHSRDLCLVLCVGGFPGRCLEHF